MALTALTVLCLLVGPLSRPASTTSGGLDAVASAGSADREGKHAGKPKFDPPQKPAGAGKKQKAHTYTPVSHSVSDGEHTRTTLHSTPAYKQVSGRWTPLSSKVSRHKGRFPLRANGMALPTWFGSSRNGLMRIQTGRRPVDVTMRGAADRVPRVVKKGKRPRIAYKSVMPGVDLTYDIGASSTKERIILRRPKSPRSFTFLIKDPRHSLGTPRTTGLEAVSFEGVTGSGFTVSLAEPVAYGTGQQESAPQVTTRESASAHQKVTRTAAGYKVRVWVDKSWARGQQFPLILDPTIVYSWDEETMASAYAHTGGTACAGDPCVLSSETDGSTLVAREHCWWGPETIDAYFHANLSNIPPWIDVTSARFSVGIDTDPEDMSYPDRLVRPHSELFEPGDSWFDGEWSDPPAEGSSAEAQDGEALTVNGHPRWDFDVTEGVNAIVQAGVGDHAGFTGSSDCLETRTAGSQRSATGRPVGGTPSLRDPVDWVLAEWWYDPSLTVEYDGPILPPPLPVAQTYGCACDWFHGADVVAQGASSVNTAAGQQMKRFTDVSQPAPGVRATFARTYNGGDGADGPLGVGWTHDFNASLSENSISGDVAFRDPTGGQIVYHPLSGGNYEGDPGATGTLIELGGGGWTLTAPSGEKLTFNSNGRLVSDVDRQGRGITLGYTGSGPSAQLTTVTDEAGQVTTLTYGTTGAEDGKIVEVETDDGRTVTYDYTTVAGDPHLTAVTDTTAETTDISYDTTTGRLNKLTDPSDGEHAQNVYDGNGRINEQTDANGQVTTFDWQPVTGSGVPDGSGIQTTTDPLGYVTRELYYGHVLIKRTDSDENGDYVTRYAYDSDLNLVAVTDAYGQVTSMTYDGAGNMLTRTGPAPSEITESWTYNGEGQTLTHTDGRGKTTSYGYDLNDRLETVTDPLNHDTSYTYDGDGNVATVTSPEGRVTEYDYDAQGNLVAQTSPGGHLTTSDYDDAGNLIAQTTARGNEPGATAADFTATYTYDDAGRVLTSTDSHGTVTTYTYDDSGRTATATVVDDESNVIHDLGYTYDDAGNLLTTEDFTRTTATNTYDERGQLATSADAAGNTTTYAYDYAGRRTAVTKPRGNEPSGNPWDHTTYFNYDPLGNLYATGTPYESGWGIQHSYAYVGYDENSRPISNTTGAYRTSYTSYDDAGNVLTTTDPMGRVSTRTYDDAGRLSSQARPDQDPTTYTYDDDGLRLSETSPSGDSTWTWTYTDDGQVATKVDARGNAPLADPEDYTTSYEYDADGNLTSTTDQLGHETTRAYDALGNLVSATDARGQTKTWTYDAAARLATITPPGGADPTSYDYDQYGDLLTRTDALGHETTYTYDDIHQVTSVTDPLDRTKTYDWDADGNLASWVTARGNEVGADPEDWTVTQEWDPRGDLISRTTADPDDTVSYQRDADGLMTSYTDAAGTTTLAYNDASQLTTVEHPDTSTYGYTYNDTGNIATRTYPAGGTITYGYNDDGLIDTQTSDGLTTGYAYDPDRHLTQIEYPTATEMVENRTYDRIGRIDDIATIDASGPTIVDQFDYTRDPNGNPTAIARTRGTTTDHTAYTYDDRNWLTTECLGVTTCTSAADYISYTYDDAGNRLQMDRVGTVPDPGTIDYDYDDADQLTSIDDGSTVTNQTYDADGNLSSGGRVWNAINQMTGSNVAGTGATTYTYDALGNRTTSTTGTTPIALSWDINNPLPMLAVTTNPSTDPTAFRYTATGELLQSEHGAEDYPRSFHSHDGLGSVTDTFKTDGTPTVQSTYDAYGIAASTTLVSGAVEPQFGHTGAYLEPATGDYDLRARDYNPTTGRFNATDPAGWTDQGAYVSTYAYVNNNPLLFTDPSGMTPEDDDACYDPPWYLEVAELYCEFGEFVAEGSVEAYNNPEQAVVGTGGGFASILDYTPQGIVQNVFGMGPSDQYYATTDDLFGVDGSETGTQFAEVAGPAIVLGGLSGLRGLCIKLGGGSSLAAEASLPSLTGSIAASFEGGAYTTQTFKAGTTFYRAEGSGQGIGSFFGFSKPATASDADKLYNIAPWGNNADVVTTYRLTQDTTMYVGDVAGGTGRQALLPRGSSPESLFQQVGQEPLQ
jgi:RHS repeat-associated protein